MQLTFCGAARNVTGSCYLLEAAGRRVLVDCGLFQERGLKDRNWEAFPFDPAGIDAVILTHAHIDHSGRLPLLAKQGFVGPIYTTPAGVDLTELLLLDSAHIQEEDARYKTKRHRREGRELPPTEPLYETAHAKQAVALLRRVKYHRSIEVVPGITAVWNDAGHILGSGHVLVTVKQGTAATRVLFSGDIGMAPRPILKDPEPFAEADVLICESTYGNRLHETREFAVQKLRDVVNETMAKEGNVVIPAFAVGRTQTILYYLAALMKAGEIDEVTTFVDSPMAIRATEILRRHPDCYDEEARAVLAAGGDPIGFEPLHFTSTTSASKAINRIKGGCIIVSASGMCTAGRIKHHLQHNITRPNSTILFCGFQAVGTLGRQILERPDEVRIHGEMHRVRARIEAIGGLSGHADRNGLLNWCAAVSGVQQCYVTHGDEEPALEFAAALSERFGWPVEAPEYGQTVDL